MPVHRLSEITWEEMRDLPTSRTVAVLPIGAVEAHGPHLPLGTDLIIAEAMARAGAVRLAEHGYTVLMLPALAYAPAPFAHAFPGTLSARPETVTALLTDIAESLAAHGIGAFAIANAHFDPANVTAIKQAVHALRTRGDLIIVYPDLTRRTLAKRLTPEFLSGACHAGQYETSIVLAERPAAVRPAMSDLPTVDISLAEAIRAGDRTFAEAGGDRAYFGAPSAATREEGETTVATLGAILEEAVRAEFPDAS